jgi:hypothetical protein
MRTDGRTNGCTDTTKLMVAFRSLQIRLMLMTDIRQYTRFNFEGGTLKNDQCFCYTLGLESTSNSFPNNFSIGMILIRYPRAGLDLLRKRKLYCLCRYSNLGSSDPESSQYTDFWSVLLEDEVLVIYIEEEKSVIDFQFLEMVFRQLFLNPFPRN